MSSSLARSPLASGGRYLVLAVLGAALALLASIMQPALLLGLAILIGLALATLKIRALPVVAYWVLISFVSFTTLDSQFRVEVGGFPIGLTDLGAGLLLLGCVIHTAIQRRTTIRLQAFGLGLIAFGVYSAFSAINGLARGYPLYSVLIDVRAVTYLYLGYWAAITLLSAQRNPRLLVFLSLLSTIGFAAQQALVSARSVSIGLVQGIINQRDIGVPFFTGRYGILMSAGLLQGEQQARVWWALPSLGLGLAAMALSFVRTGWVATAAGLLVLIAIGGRAVRMVRYACLLAAAILLLAAVIPDVGALAGIISSRAVDIVSPASAATDTVAARFSESQLALASLKTPIDWLAGVGLGLSVSDPLRGNQHNSFVWLLSKEGAIGLLLFLATFASYPVAQALRALRVGRREKILLAVLLSAHVSNLVSGYASGHLTLWPYCPIVGMTVGWLTSLASDENVGSGKGRLDTQ